MTTRLLVGDVFERMAELPDDSFDLIVTSPPFLALRSYLPDDHPDKDKEIGSEATPAEYLDTLLALTAEWRRLLAPHGSLAVELGDTYAGSGGAGGDYNDDGWRQGQPKFGRLTGAAVPLDKSLLMLPTLYPACLAYGRNLLTGEPSPAGRWRIRNLKPWIRSNPPVGALGDKERPATSYITVACTSASRWFDLDAVRTPHTTPDTRSDVRYPRQMNGRLGTDGENGPSANGNNPGGAPPLDWWHPVDATIDAVIDQRAGKYARSGGAGDDMECSICHGEGGGYVRVGPDDWEWESCDRCRGIGYIPVQNFSGRRDPHAHGAAAGPDDDDSSRLATDLSSAPNPALIDAVIDAEINARAGKRNGGEVRPGSDVTVVGKLGHDGGDATNNMGHGRYHQGALSVGARGVHIRRALTEAGLLPPGDFYDVSPKGYAGSHYAVFPPELVKLLVAEMCPPGGTVLDPFVGSGTTLMVCSGMGRNSVGIDLDERNVDLAVERCGMFLEVDYGLKAAT